MTRYHKINGKRVPFTPEEEAARDAEELSAAQELASVAAGELRAALEDERDRRLAQGFNYDFGDSRGVHEIGTDPDDMKAWSDEVTPLAQALVTNSSNDTISIKTNTGSASVTGQEWMDILIAAGNVRQPIWQAYFALLADTPADFNDDSYWP